MSLTFSLVLVLCIIIILFSDEFHKLGKKVLGIRGAPLLLPLFAASLIAIDFKSFWYKDILFIANGFHMFLTEVSRILDIGIWGRSIVGVLLMVGMATVPQFVINWYRRRDHRPPYKNSSYMSLVLWALTAYFYVLTTWY
jgi:hypothetical protein